VLRQEEEDILLRGQGGGEQQVCRRGHGRQRRRRYFSRQSRASRGWGGLLARWERVALLLYFRTNLSRAGQEWLVHAGPVRGGERPVEGDASKAARRSFEDRREKRATLERKEGRECGRGGRVEGDLLASAARKRGATERRSAQTQSLPPELRSQRRRGKGPPRLKSNSWGDCRNRPIIALLAFDVIDVARYRPRARLCAGAFSLLAGERRR